MSATNNSIYPFNKALLLPPIFFILSLIGVFYHEIWLDEAQHYLLARDSDSLSELIYACRNEGHPLLWNIILFLVTRFSQDPFYMQLAHIIIGCLSVIIIAKSNLTLLEKMLVIFGYYLFFEYNIISRNYGLSIFFIFFLISKYISQKENVITLAAIIFLLANTHLFSLIFSIAFVLAYITNNKDLLCGKTKKTIFAALLIILSGWAISIYCIIPPNNYGINFRNYDSSGYLSGERILKTLSVSLKGIFYVPDYTAEGNHAENSLYYLTLNMKPWLIYTLSIATIIIPLYIVKNNKFAFTLFCSFFIIFLPVYYFLPLVNGIRYFGFLYVIFIACYWIARPQIAKVWLRFSLAIFILQFVNSIFMFSLDLRYPFSESKNVNNYIKQNRMHNENVFILDRILRPAISAYSGEKYFGVENGHPLSYCLWQTYMPDSFLKSELNKALNENTSSLIIASGPISHFVDTNKVEKLMNYSNGIIRNENTVVYRYKR